MKRYLVVLLLILANSFAPSSARAAEENKPATDAQAIAEVKAADDFYVRGKYEDAIAKYQAVLKSTASLEVAQAGLTMALLRSGQTDAALQTVLAALQAHPDSARLMAVLGKVKFRRGEMGEAEQAFQASMQIDPKTAQAYLGLARLYRSLSMYAHSYAALKRAHDLDPKDPEVQLMWLQTLPRKDRLAGLQVYLAGPHPESAALAHFQQYLEKTKDAPPHSCRLVNNAQQAEVKLPFVHDQFPHIEGLGVELKVNDRTHVLLLDTGASGIVLDRKAANKAAVKRLVDITYGGIGDQGDRTGYLAVADRIRIGALEFQDCIITVSDKRTVDNDADGLIGADVFASYLVDIDLPQRVLRLSQLPNRPGDENVTTSLNSDDEGDSVESEADTNNRSKEGLYQPKDRYIAPEMKTWTPVFRFGHMLLVPTRLNNSKPLLFLIDTGAFQNTLGTQAARATAKLGISDVAVEGASGRVSDVYRAEKVDFQFGRFHQQNINAVALDLSGISAGIGTEISGTLGFNLLSMLEVKIDYRDGLVDFVYRDNKGVAH